MRNWTDAELRKAVKSGPDLSDTAWRQSTNMADHLRAAAKYELERRKREKKKTSPRLRKNSRHGSSPGEIGKWEKTADGYYLPGQAVSFLVKKEAIKVRGRRKQMWALYANRHEDAWEKGWKLWLNNIPTLTKAKGIVREYVGREDDRVRRGQVSPAGRPPLMPNPRRRKNVAFGKGKPERNHPYANILRSEGLTYSHSVPVNHSGGKVYHHVYRLDDTDFYVSYYQKPGGTKWLWEGSVSGSGRMHQGFGMSKLNKYLRGAVKRHRTKAANPRRRR